MSSYQQTGMLDAQFDENSSDGFLFKKYFREGNRILKIKAVVLFDTLVRLIHHDRSEGINWRREKKLSKTL